MARIGQYNEKKCDFQDFENKKQEPSIERNAKNELDTSLKNLSSVLSVTTSGCALAMQCLNGFDGVMRNYRQYQEEGLRGDIAARMGVVAGRILWEVGWISILMRADASIHLAFQELSSVSKKVQQAEAHVQKLTFQVNHCHSGSAGRHKKASLNVQIGVHHEILLQRKKEFDLLTKKLEPIFQTIQQAFSEVEVRISVSRLEIAHWLSIASAQAATGVA